MLERVLALLCVVFSFTCCDNKSHPIAQVTDTSRFTSEHFSVQFQTCQTHDTPKIWTYGTFNPYDTLSEERGDSLIISFGFVADCCLTFSGRAEDEGDTLVLKYGLDRGYAESCGCWCEYHLTYRINKAGRDWKGFKMVYKEDEIFDAGRKDNGPTDSVAVR